MITEYVDSLLWQRHVTLTTRYLGGGGVVKEVRVGSRCSGLKPIGCHHKFYHVAKQNVIGSANIVRLCLLNMWGHCL